MRIRTLSLVLSSVLWCAASAHAQEEDYARSGLYVSGLGSWAFEDFEDEIEGLVPGISVNIDDSWAAHGRIGYRLRPRVALELQGAWYTEYNIDLLGIEAAEFEGWSVAAISKLYLLTGRIQPYVLVGSGYLELELSDKLGLGLSVNSSGALLRGGGGVEVYLSRNIVLSLESAYTMALGGIKGFDFWIAGAGLQYRF